MQFVAHLDGDAPLIVPLQYQAHLPPLPLLQLGPAQGLLYKIREEHAIFCLKKDNIFLPLLFFSWDLRRRESRFLDFLNFQFPTTEFGLAKEF
jgi:hypothetical protein